MKTYLAAATQYMVPICMSCGRVTWRAVDEGNGETFLRNHDFGPAFEPREDSLGKDEAGVTSVACVEVAAVDACVIEGVEERGEVKVSG